MDDMEIRIFNCYQSASVVADYVDRGTAWYSNYRELLNNNRGTVPLKNACGVIAVSSINTNPTQGMNWATKFMRGVLNGHLQVACNRAATILTMLEDNLDAILYTACPATSPARKVRNFGCNVFTGGMHCSHIVPCVTVDRWANRIATGDMKAGVPSGKNYDAIADAYRSVAQIVGLPVAILQAITWVSVAEPNGPKN